MSAHTLTGIAVVMSGAIALLTKKGSTVHKLAGNFYVGLMLLMGLIVALGAWTLPGTISSLGVIFVFFMNYLLLTSLSTIRRSENILGRWDYLAPAASLLICCTGVLLGIEALNNPGRGEHAPPVAAYFFFATLALLTMCLDVNNLRIGGVRGKHRILRHLWRMTCALFFATSSLFTGPGTIIFPEAVRGSVVFSIPQILVVLVALFWICKTLFLDTRQDL